MAVLDEGADGTASWSCRASGRPTADDRRERDALPRHGARGRHDGPRGDGRPQHHLAGRRSAGPAWSSRTTRGSRSSGSPSGCLITGLVLTFYFPRRRAWARIDRDRIGLAFVADRYVDRDREFERLRDAVAHATRPQVVVANATGDGWTRDAGTRQAGQRRPTGQPCGAESSGDRFRSVTVGQPTAASAGR